MGDSRADLLAEIERLFQQLTWHGRQLFTRRIDRFDLTVPQYLVLYTVARLGPKVTMSEVIDELQLPASSMTSISDRLVRLGLIERGALPSDRRAVLVSITEAGRGFVDTIEAAQRDDLVTMLDGVSNSDLTQFNAVLARLLEGVERAMAESSVAVPSGDDRPVAPSDSGAPEATARGQAGH